MLIEFTVENYLSFKDETTFSMVADKSISKDLENNKFLEPVSKKFELLKSAVIYGANASGKSNLLKSLAFMKQKVFTSFRDSLINNEENQDINNFKLSSSTENKPSMFEVIFIQNNKRYRYGFEIDNKKVCSEWLFYVPEKRETNLFKREGNKFKINESFKEGKGLEEKTREDVLFLSLVAQFNGSISKEILDWFNKITYISGIEGRFNRTYSIFKAKQDPIFKEKLIHFLKKLDVGIENIEINDSEFDVKLNTIPNELPENIKNDFSIVFNKIKSLSSNIKNQNLFIIRNKYNEQENNKELVRFDLENMESDGTKKIIALLGYWFDIFENGKILIIDELDSSLHSLLTIEMIKLFHSTSSNPKNAQLIFSLHDTTILSNEFFRRDQIWFIEKDPFGASDLYSLVEYKLDNDTKVRNDASYNKNYLKGKYGAIPFLGNIQELFKI
jgi:AAA15 family ATPase/GTPase